jgi:hypothetical protein
VQVYGLLSFIFAKIKKEKKHNVHYKTAMWCQKYTNGCMNGVEENPRDIELLAFSKPSLALDKNICIFKRALLTMVARNYSGRSTYVVVGGVA